MPGYRTSFAREILHEVGEIEKHLHSNEHWFGAAAVPSGTHFADEMAPGIDHFTIDGGNLTWGSWVQLFGPDDTPVVAGNLFFDFHRVQIEDTERTGRHVIQIGHGVSGAAALAANDVTTFVLNTTSPKEAGPIDVNHDRIPAGELVWARCYVEGENTGTVDFFAGIHEYDD